MDEHLDDRSASLLAAIHRSLLDLPRKVAEELALMPEMGRARQKRERAEGQEGSQQQQQRQRATQEKTLYDEAQSRISKQSREQLDATRGFFASLSPLSSAAGKMAALIGQVQQAMEAIERFKDVFRRRDENESLASKKVSETVAKDYRPAVDKPRPERLPGQLPAAPAVAPAAAPAATTTPAEKSGGDGEVAPVGTPEGSPWGRGPWPGGTWMPQPGQPKRERFPNVMPPGAPGVLAGQRATLPWARPLKVRGWRGWGKSHRPTRPHFPESFGPKGNAPARRATAPPPAPPPLPAVPGPAAALEGAAPSTGSIALTNAIAGLTESNEKLTDEVKSLRGELKQEKSMLSGSPGGMAAGRKKTQVDADGQSLLHAIRQTAQNTARKSPGEEQAKFLGSVLTRGE